MNYSNIANLPQPLVSALIFDDYDSQADISASGLPVPPRIRQLEKRHGDNITVDVSTLVWKLIGNIGHKILERADTNNHFSEERLFTSLHGWKISGKADLLGPDMTLSDYKFTSVWAMKYAKKEWEQQVNMYALLYRKYGFLVERARITAILRDWSKMKANREPDYPQVGVVVREVPLWTPEEQEAFLGQRVRLHQEAEKLDDENLPMCTPDERWHKPDVWAVKKKGGKRAISGGLHTDLRDAYDMANGLPKPTQYEVEYRPGEDTRCLWYCPVKNFCAHGRSLAVNVESLPEQISA